MQEVRYGLVQVTAAETRGVTGEDDQQGEKEVERQRNGRNAHGFLSTASRPPSISPDRSRASRRTAMVWGTWPLCHFSSSVRSSPSMSSLVAPLRSASRQGMRSPSGCPALAAAPHRGRGRRQFRGRGRCSISATSPLASISASSIRLLPRLGPSLPFFGQINYPTVLQHIHWCARFAAEFPRSPSCTAQGRIRRHDIRVLRSLRFPIHGLSPEAISRGTGPELSYNAQLLTRPR